MGGKPCKLKKKKLPEVHTLFYTATRHVLSNKTCRLRSHGQSYLFALPPAYILQGSHDGSIGWEWIGWVEYGGNNK